jgi:hypothetical protein
LREDDEIDSKRICCVCVGEEYLRAEIKKEGKAAKCTYCSKRRRSFTINELADYVETAFEQHFRRTSPELSRFESERSGDPVVWVIAEAAKIDESPATDVQKILEDRHSDFESAQIGEECEFDSVSYYVEIGPNDIEMRAEWRGFEHSLKTETRFFNQHAQATLGAVFEGLVDHETQDGRRVVVHAGPGLSISSLYRARVFQSSEALERALEHPDIGIGPPPIDAATAGRMNARGISVFYGALNPVVALAEIRPPVGSRVLLGKFEFLRPVRLLDVAALQSVFVKGSIFDGGYIGRLERAKFLERLSHRIAMPVMPNDEPSDYLITQAIADYLSTQVKIDGILYPSVQAGGTAQNIVLFHSAARVRKIELPPKAEIRAQLGNWTEDGHEHDYYVREEVAPPSKSVEDEDGGFPTGMPLSLYEESDVDHDGREVTLTLDLPSLRVHHVNGVTFATDDYVVKRHRTERRKTKF